MLSNQQVQALLALVREAGNLTLQYWRGDLAVQAKADSSPVTEADLAAHRLLAAGLPQILDIPVLSEEDCDIALAERQQWQRWWLVDPLDGTREFVAGSDEYTVNVALIEQGRPLFGVVGVPAAEVIYYGGAEQGSQRLDSQDSQPLKVAPIQEPLRVTVSKSHGSALQEALLESLQQQGQIERINAGSSLKFCWLAEGRADFYPRLSPTSQWDTAAAQAVLEGAGGQVLDAQGRALTYPAAVESWLNPFFVALPTADRRSSQLLQQWRKTMEQ